MTIKCDLCGKGVERSRSQLYKPARFRFCSRLCQNTHQARRNGLAKSARTIALRTVPDSEQPKDHRVVRLLSGETVRVSIQDYDVALRHPWFIHTQGYAHSGANKYLHRLILERIVGRPLTRKDVTDHINHDKIDNRRENLRLATVAQNGGNMKRPAHNTSGYKGAAYRPKACRSRPWIAEIKVDQKPHFIGFFKTAEEAAYAYDQWALQIFGEFAHTNFEYA